MPNIGYMPGLDYGAGFDSIGAQVRGDAVIRTEPEAVQDTDEGQSSLIRIRMIESQEDMNRVLGISAEANIGIKHIAGGGGKFDFSEECQYHEHSVWLIAHVFVTNSWKQMRDVQLRPEAVALLNQGHEDTFRERYGDRFVRGMQTGGELAVVLEIETTGTTDFQQVKANIEGSGIVGGVPVSAATSVNNSLQWATFNRQTYLSIYQRGGTQGQTMTRGSNVSIDDLVNHIFSFPGEVRAGKSESYSALILDYKSLDLPFGPNWVDQLNARQVLDSVMAQRGDALALFNKVNYIRLHVDQFAPFDKEKYKGYADKLSVAINILTQAASACVNSPKDARFPENVDLPTVTDWPTRKEGTPVHPDQVPHHTMDDAERLRLWAITHELGPISGRER